MAAKTEHLGLHQWEPEDDFLRVDFNEDHGKIDAAVGTLQNWAATSCVAGSVVNTDGKTDMNVELGFRPRLVILGTDGQTYKSAMVCFDGFNFSGYYEVGYSSPRISAMEVVTFSDTGFQIENAFLYSKGDAVQYVAFR